MSSCLLCSETPSDPDRTQEIQVDKLVANDVAYRGSGPIDDDSESTTSTWLFVNHDSVSACVVNEVRCVVFFL